MSHACINADDSFKRNRFKYDLVIRQLVAILYKVNLRLTIFPTLDVGESFVLDLDQSRWWFENRKHIFLSGLYLVAPVSLALHQDTIRAFFRPVSAVRRPAEGIVDSLREEVDIVIGIHVRHGDYRTFASGNMYYTIEEYADVMRDLRSQLPQKKLGFVVCSDEQINRSKFGDLHVRYGPGTVLSDLHALSICDFIVGPGSTFNQWASFVGRVPLHTLNWKMQKAYSIRNPLMYPSMENDFKPILSDSFAPSSKKIIEIHNAIRHRYQ